MNSNHSKKSIRPTALGFLAWARLQPVTKRWIYCNQRYCPFACYLRSLGVRSPWVGSAFWYKSAADVSDLSKSNRIPEAVAHVLLHGLRMTEGRIWEQPVLVAALSKIVNKTKP